MNQDSQITSTEARILESARKVFYLKGLKGARMEEIAKEANINSALLHYYFRTKEKLYLRVFSDAVSNLKGQIFDLLNKDMPLDEKITFFVDKYINFLIENPYLPMFIINELNQNPDRIVEIFNIHDEIKNNFIINQFNNEILKGNIRPINFLHFIMNLLSLCIIPFLAKPIFKNTFQLSEEQFKSIILERKQMIPEIIIKWLKN